MCFTEQDGNVLTFPLENDWKGTISITCSGSYKKQVIISWNFSGGGPTDGLNSCQDGPTGSFQRKNDTNVTVNPTITILYAPSPCSTPGPINMAVNDATMNDCQNGSEAQYSSWTFECPGSEGETVEVTVATEYQPDDPDNHGEDEEVK